MQSGSREKPCNIRGLSLANLDEQPAASGDQLASDRGDPAIGIEPILAAIERKPLTGAYRGYTIVTAPPPSSGGVGILQMLGVLEGTGFEKAGAGSAAAVVLGMIRVATECSPGHRPWM